MNHTYHTCIRIRKCFNRSSMLNTLDVWSIHVKVKKNLAKKVKVKNVNKEHMFHNIRIHLQMYEKECLQMHSNILRL